MGNKNSGGWNKGLKIEDHPGLMKAHLAAREGNRKKKRKFTLEEQEDIVNMYHNNIKLKDMMIKLRITNHKLIYEVLRNSGCEIDRTKGSKLYPEAKTRTTLYNRMDLLKRKYGLTLDDYDNMYNKQNGCCAICNRKFENTLGGNKNDKLHVDHCHETGKVRGLLCFYCNLAIGKLQDDPEIIMNAYLYLVNNN